MKRRLLISIFASLCNNNNNNNNNNNYYYYYYYVIIIIIIIILLLLLLLLFRSIEAKTHSNHVDFEPIYTKMFISAICVLFLIIYYNPVVLL